MSATNDIAILEAWEKHNLLGFVAFLETCDATNDITFSEIIKHSLERYGVTATQIAKQFEIDTSTASRWAAGKSKPHHLVRPLVVSWIKATVEVRAHALASKPKDVEKLEAAAIERQRRKPKRTNVSVPAVA